MYLLYLLLVNKFIGPTDSAHSEEMNASIGGSCRGLFGLISNFSPPNVVNGAGHSPLTNYTSILPTIILDRPG